MGGFLSNLLDTNSDYNPNGTGGGVQAGNPYSRDLFNQSMQNQQQVFGQQQALAGKLQEQMAGIGPNPAQTQYQQNVGTNIANSQGLISSQRGLNPALASRMGANAASQANQQAAAQSSILQQQQQLGATQNLGNLYGQMQQGNLGQQGMFNQANLGAMHANVGVAGANQQGKQALAGGLMSSVGSVMQGPMKAHGGMIEKYAAGGEVSDGPRSSAGKYLMAHGGSVPAMVSPGEVYLPPEKVEEVARGGKDPLKSGKKIPGQAKVKGDSLKNDTVSTQLEEGGVVIPRTVVNSKNAPEQAAKFVAAVLARNKHGK